MNRLCDKYGGGCVGCRDCEDEPPILCDICRCTIAAGEGYYTIGEAADRCVCADCIEGFYQYV